MEFKKLSAFLQDMAERKEYKGKKKAQELIREKANYFRRLHSQLSLAVSAFLNVKDDNEKEDSPFYKERLDILASRYDWTETLKDDDWTTEVFAEFLKPQYEAPEDFVELRHHLEVFTEYYTYVAPFMVNLPISLSNQIDFVAIKVASKANLMRSLLDWTGEEFDNIKKMNLSKVVAKKGRAQAIIDAFYRIDTKDMSFHKIASTIYEKLQEENERRLRKKKTPSKDTIKRALKNDPSTYKYLKEQMII